LRTQAQHTGERARTSSSLDWTVQRDFRVEVRSECDATVLAVSGELDLATSPLLEAELDLVNAQADAGPLILDLRELEFMDSTGLSILVRTHQRALQAGRDFGVIRGRPQVDRLLSLTGVGERMPVADTLEALLRDE
jgi:anti-anti-sigma factor